MPSLNKNFLLDKKRRLNKKKITWVVSQEKNVGDFTSIQQAIDALPRNDLKNSCYQIVIKKGLYHERIHLTRHHVQLIGEEMESTIIAFDLCNQMVVQDGSIPGTYGSNVVNIDAKYCGIKNLTIRNDFDFITNQQRDVKDPEQYKHTQSVALLLGHHADQIYCENIQLISYHDTLYASAGRSYFDNCMVSGSIDFIFGAGQVLFHECDIVARKHLNPAKDKSWGYLTAPSTDINQPQGFIFHHCRLLKEEGVPKLSYALGRPWHPTTLFDDGRYADPNAIGHCAFLECQIDDHIYGWDRMGGKSPTGEMMWFEPESARFEEYKNSALTHSNLSLSFFSPLPSQKADQLMQQVQFSLQQWLPTLRCFG